MPSSTALTTLQAAYSALSNSGYRCAGEWLALACQAQNVSALAEAAALTTRSAAVAKDSSTHCSIAATQAVSRSLKAAPGLPVVFCFGPRSDNMASQEAAHAPASEKQEIVKAEPIRDQGEASDDEDLENQQSLGGVNATESAPLTPEGVEAVRKQVSRVCSMLPWTLGLCSSPTALLPSWPCRWSSTSVMQACPVTRSS